MKTLAIRHLDVNSPENMQALQVAFSVDEWNKFEAENEVYGDGSHLVYVSVDGSELVMKDGTPFTPDSLAVSLRARLEPGHFVRGESEDGEKGESEWEALAAIPRAPIKAYMAMPKWWYRLPRHAGPTGETGWDPVPMDRISTDPEVPLVGHRVDGKCLFYRNKVNAAFGDSEGGKTWLCLLAAAQELRAGRSVAYIDYEDSPRGIKSRLMALGVSEDILNERESFMYLNPFGPIAQTLSDERMQEALSMCSLVVVDAMTEALSAAGLNSNSDVEVASWFNEFAKPIAALGPAVVIIDHQPKSADNKGQQTGSQHKKSAVDGASVQVSNRKPFRPGEAGHSALVVGKDRPGGVRAASLDGKAFGTLRMDAAGPHTLRIDDPVAGPTEAEKSAGMEFVIGEVIDRLEAEGTSPTVRNIKAALKETGDNGKSEVVEEAIRSVKTQRAASPVGG